MEGLTETWFQKPGTLTSVRVVFHSATCGFYVPNNSAPFAHVGADPVQFESVQRIFDKFTAMQHEPEAGQEEGEEEARETDEEVEIQNLKSQCGTADAENPKTLKVLFKPCGGAASSGRSENQKMLDLVLLEIGRWEKWLGFRTAILLGVRLTVRVTKVAWPNCTHPVVGLGWWPTTLPSRGFRQTHCPEEPDSLSVFLHIYIHLSVCFSKLN